MYSTNKDEDAWLTALLATSAGDQANDGFGTLPFIRPQPQMPSKWTYTYLRTIKDRLKRREDNLEARIEGVTQGRTISAVDQITIGSGKFYPSLAVMFLDICGFSNWYSCSDLEQKNVLRIMNIFMAEMLNIVRDFGGTFEKNTGDGLMAYFDSGIPGDAQRVERALEAALVMFYVNESELSPWFNSHQLWPVTFRIGIDVGPVTIGRVGIPNLADQMVAIGTTANVACKLMRLVDEGGICIGNESYTSLDSTWKSCCSPAGNTTFVYRLNNAPYFGWKVNHRLDFPGFTIPTSTGW